MKNTSEELTPKQRLKAIASLFAQALLRLRNHRKGLEVSPKLSLNASGSQDPQQTGRQGGSTPGRP